MHDSITTRPPLEQDKYLLFLPFWHQRQDASELNYAILLFFSAGLVWVTSRSSAAGRTPVDNAKNVRVISYPRNIHTSLFIRQRCDTNTNRNTFGEAF